VAADHLVGLLELDEPDPRAAGDAADRAILELFASQAVTAIRLARAYETTRLGSLRDPLTGIANHGHFQETLYREISRHERHAESSSSSSSTSTTSRPSTTVSATPSATQS
jgi:GAF domain-containing protein